MRAVLALALIFSSGPFAWHGRTALAQTVLHHYTRADRYAGCLVGYLIPALRRGSSHDKAMAAAEDRCFPLSQGLSERDLREVVDEVNFFVTLEEKG